MGTQGTVLKRHRRLPVFAFAMAVVLTAAIAVLAAQGASLRSGTGPATTGVGTMSEQFAWTHAPLGGQRGNGECQRYDHWVRNVDGTYTYYRCAGDPGSRVHDRWSSHASRNQLIAERSGP